MIKKTVIHLGGSIVCPDDKIEVDYLIELRQFILQKVSDQWQFVIVIGGGGLARSYQGFVSEIVSDISNEDKDWIGIHATRMNA
ncbi:MAG TPA: UMP kinase, partial [Candidatus Portnoybacteria bacterium]|nr:UMP kinase [Candidatus Portnoybacteria bacterium]